MAEVAEGVKKLFKGKVQGVDDIEMLEALWAYIVWLSLMRHLSSVAWK